MSVPTRVTQIIAARALRDPADLVPHMTLQELGLDSMGMVETIFALEEAFEITIPFNANAAEGSSFDGASTIAQVVQLVEGLIESRAA